MKIKPTKRFEWSRGFTFIELLITMLIMTIVFTFGYANYRDFSRKQEIEGAQRLLKSDLRLAQKQASTGHKPSGSACDDPEDLSGYKVESTSSTAYRISAVCSGGEITTKNVYLTQGYSNIVVSSFSVTFNVLAQGTNLASDLQIDLSQTVGLLTRMIVISPEGTIN